MAIQILKGGLKKEVQKPQIPINKEESTTDAIIRNIKRAPVTVAKLAGVPGDIYTALTGDEAGAITSKDIESGIERLTGSEKGAFKPKGSLEEFGDMLISDAPFLAFSAATGGLGALLPATARSVGANVGIKAAQESGFGPVGQIFGSILGAKAPGKISSVAKNFIKKNPQQTTKNLLTHMQKAATENYNKSNATLKNVKGDVGQLPNELLEIVKDVNFIPNKKNLSAALDIERVFEDIEAGKLSINDAKKYAQNFKNEGYNKNHSMNITNAYKRAGKTLRDWIYGLEDQVGEGITQYKRADQLHTLNKSQQEFERIVNSSAQLRNLWNKSFLNSAFSYGTKKLGTIPASRAYRYWREPETRQYLKEIYDAIELGSDKEAIIAMNKLGKSAIEYQNKELDNKEPKKFKILKGGLR